MKDKFFYGALSVVVLIPTFALAEPTYGTEVLAAEATNLQAFLFGPAMKVVGAVGAAFGVVRGFQTQSLQPLLIFGGLGAATVIIPKLLTAMFG